MTKTLTLFIAPFVALAMSAPPAFAQSDPKLAVSVMVGGSTGQSDSGAALGGSVLYDLTDRVSLEASGASLDRGSGADALVLGAGLLVHLRPSTENVVPYAAIGGGLYRASFDLANPRYLGPTASQFAPGATLCASPGIGYGSGPGAGFGPGAGTCTGGNAGYWGVGALANQYARRLGPLTFPSGSAGWESVHFNDAAVNIGGGIRFNLSDRWMLRPDARALVIFSDGDAHAVALFGLNLAYRF